MAAPHELQDLLQAAGFPGPTRKLIAQFALEHPVARLLKELDFEQGPSALHEGYTETLVTGDDMMEPHKVWAPDHRSYKIFLRRSPTACMCPTFNDQSGEPSHAMHFNGMSGHKHAEVLKMHSSGMVEQRINRQTWWERLWWDEQMLKRNKYRGNRKRFLNRH